MMILECPVLSTTLADVKLQKSVLQSGSGPLFLFYTNRRHLFKRINQFLFENQKFFYGTKKLTVPLAQNMCHQPSLESLIFCVSKIIVLGSESLSS